MADRSTFVADTEPFMRPLYSTAVRLTTNASDAEDLVQETYLRAYRAYGTFEPGTVDIVLRYFKDGQPTEGTGTVAWSIKVI